MSTETFHTGACHCGAVMFTFRAPIAIDVTDCNCSVCSLSAYQHVFVPKADLTFTQGEDNLSLYTFGSHAAQHLFCKTCGIKPLYVPKSHPDSYSVNLRCVTSGTMTVARIIPFDGQNWDANIAALKKET